VELVPPISNLMKICTGVTIKADMTPTYGDLFYVAKRRIKMKCHCKINWNFLRSKKTVYSRYPRASIIYAIFVKCIQNIQGCFYFVDCFHGDRCVACCERYTDFADESAFLMADNVRNEGELLLLFPDHRC
jgi:hypothetical protein